MLRLKLAERNGKLEEVKEAILEEEQPTTNKNWMKPTSTYSIRTDKIKAALGSPKSSRDNIPDTSGLKYDLTAFLHILYTGLLLNGSQVKLRDVDLYISHKKRRKSNCFKI